MLRLTLLFLAFQMALSCSTQAASYKDLPIHTVEYAEDSTRTLLISDLLDSPSRLSFQKSNKPTLNFGFTSSAYWIKFPFTNASQTMTEVWLEIAYPILQDVEVYLVNSQSQIVMKSKTGTRRPLSERKILTSNIVIPLTVEPSQQYHIYLRIQTRGSMEVPLRLWEPAAWIADNDAHNIAQGIFFGALGIMALYNIFVFLSVRSASYLHYVGFVISFMIFQSMMKGYTFLYVLPNHQHIVSWVLPLSVGLCSLFSIGFALTFLKFHGTRSVIARLLYALAAFFGICLLAIPFTSYRLIVSTLSIASTLGCALMLAAGINRWLAGKTEARFYVLAWTSYTIGGVLFGLSKLGIIGSNFYTLNGQQIGALLEAVMISMALADRLNTLRRENKLYSENLARANSSLASANAQLQTYIESVEQIVDIKTRNIKSIFATIRAGIFTVDDRMKIEKEHSPFLTEIMGKPIDDDTDPIEYLFHEADIRQDVISSVRSSLTAALGEPLFAWEVNSGHLPKEFSFTKNSSKLVVTCEFSPILRDNLVERILIVIKDITDIRLLEAESKETRMELELLSQLSQIDERKFRMFVHSTHDWLNIIPELARMSVESERSQLIQRMFIHIHTLKGNAGSLNLWPLVEEAHVAEHYLSEVRNDPSLWDTDAIMESLGRLGAIVKNCEQIFTQRLGRSADPVVQLKAAEVESILFQITPDVWQLISSSLPLQHLLDRISHSLWQDAASFLRDLTKGSARLARELGKEPPVIDIQCDKLFLPSRIQDFFFNTLTHLIRNALDHGLEDRDERIRKGKGAAGSVSISLHLVGSRVEFLFHDDGRGIDLKKVFALAQKKNLVDPAQKYRPEQIAEFIFLPGFSTRTSISTISGRGVGMDAVYASVQDCGGTIDIMLGPEDVDGFRSLCLKIHLPAHLVHAAAQTQIEAA